MNPQDLRPLHCHMVHWHLQGAAADSCISLCKEKLGRLCFVKEEDSPSFTNRPLEKQTEKWQLTGILAVPFHLWSCPLTWSNCREAVKRRQAYRALCTVHWTNAVPFRQFESKKNNNKRNWNKLVCRSCHNYVCFLDAAFSQVNTTTVSAPNEEEKILEFSQSHY